MPNIGDAALSNGDIMREIRELKRQVRELSAARRAEHATIGQSGMRVKGTGTIRSDTYDGDLAAGDPGTTGWALGADRLALGGQFVSPIAFDVKDNDESNFGLTIAEADRAISLIEVPPWADTALVTCGAFAQAKNSRAVDDFMLIRPLINGDGVAALFFEADPSGGFATGCVFVTQIVTNPGPTISIGCGIASNGGDWTADPSTGCAAHGFAVFIRSS